MDTRTGQILPFEEVEKKPKKDQKHFIPIPENQVDQVRGMNRAERRKWAKEQRRKSK